VLSTDQSHFRKYLATLGVAVAAGTISLAGLFLRVQDALTVNESELEKMTALARQALVRRQEYLAVATDWLPVFVLVGLILGASLASYGLVGWSRRQSVSDELEEIEREKGRNELLRLTDAERVTKLQADAEDALSSDAPPVNEGAEPGQPPVNRAPSSSLSSPEDRRRWTRRVANVRSKLAEIELNIAAMLEAYLSPAYVVEIGAQVRSRDGRRQELDIVVSSRDGEPAYVLEIKYIVSGFAKNINNRINDALTAAVFGASLLGEEVTPIVVIAYEEADPDLVYRAQSTANYFAQTFASRPKVLIVSVDQLERMNASDLGEFLGIPPAPSG